MELEYGSAGLGVSLPDFGKARDYDSESGQFSGFKNGVAARSYRPSASDNIGLDGCYPIKASNVRKPDQIPIWPGNLDPLEPLRTKDIQTSSYQASLTKKPKGLYSGGKKIRLDTCLRLPVLRCPWRTDV